jgi:hypothetical protein
MTFKETMAELFSTAEGTYYKWKKEQRPIIALLEKYFTREDLEEFLETGRISKFEIVEEFKMILQGSKLDYLGFISKHLKNSNEFDFFTDFYYRFLVYVNQIQHTSKDSDIEFQNIFQLNDALPSFLINNSFAKLEEWENHKLQYNIRQINSMDQNTTNFILLNLSNDFSSLVQRSDIATSDEYRKAGIIHSLMFSIYKYHPNLDYEEKVKLLGSVLGMDASIVFEKILWKIIEVEHYKIIEAIKMYK